MKSRIITAIALMAILLPTIIVAGVWFDILAVIVIALSCHEIISVCKKPNVHPYIYLIVFGFFLLSFYLSRDVLLINSVSIITLLVALLIASIFDEALSIERAFYIFTMSILVCLGLHILYVIRLNYGIYHLLILAIATYGSDTGAYFAGVFFGKHKLIPRLSPNKTVEGSIGGVIVGSILSILFGFVVSIFVPGFKFDIIFAGICILLTMTSQIGDLIFSSVKRLFFVKDYSNLLPGHGGVLDRLDSILFNAVIFGTALTYLSIGLL